MDRPINFRPASWQFLRTQARYGTPYDPAIPGKLVYETGMFRHVELMMDSVVALDDESDYLIDRAAANALANGATTITLHRLFDHRELTVLTEDLFLALRKGTVFDQLQKRAELRPVQP